MDNDGVTYSINSEKLLRKHLDEDNRNATLKEAGSNPRRLRIR